MIHLHDLAFNLNDKFNYKIVFRMRKKYIASKIIGLTHPKVDLTDSFQMHAFIRTTGFSTQPKIEMPLSEYLRQMEDRLAKSQRELENRIANSREEWIRDLKISQEEWKRDLKYSREEWKEDLKYSREEWKEDLNSSQVKSQESFKDFLDSNHWKFVASFCAAIFGGIAIYKSSIFPWNRTTQHE